MVAAGKESKSKNAKLVLLGDVGAGKSSIVLRFVKDQFVDFQESTIGAAFFSQKLAVDDETVKFDIWDTAGQERYHSLAPMNYRGAAAAIVVYDITNVVEHLFCKPPLVVPKNGFRNFTPEEAQKYAEEKNLLFKETSAKTANNVNEIFHEIAKRLVKDQRVQKPSGMILVDRPASRQNNASCCS